MLDNKTPLCIDCDGTLISTDLLHEAVFLMLKQYPLGILFLPFWLLKGKAYLKQRIAEKVRFDWASLPYRQDLLEIIHRARDDGRKVILATASPQVWADGVAGFLGCFDEVIGTNAHNMSGHQKANVLAQKFGEKQFIYAGDRSVDLLVWQRSAGAILVSNSNALKQKLLQNSISIQTHIQPTRKGIKAYLRMLRVHQWLKNLLIFVPLLAAHQLFVAKEFFDAVLAFISFSLCASSVYILNDLLDLESDRQHVRKRNRPLASGVIPIWQGIAVIPLLLAISIGICCWLPIQFFYILCFYYVITLAYSVRLKRQIIVDVMLLAGLYTIRIIAGASATNIVPSFWLLAFSMFMFLSLALVKRYSELLVTLQANKKEPAGRGYMVEDLPVLMAVGASSGIGSVLIIALYINDSATATMYEHVRWLWLAPAILLYWVTRIWMKAHRGQVDDDPVVFASKDWQSLVVVFVMALIFLGAVFAPSLNIIPQ